jgi:glycolate oxidase iron-sulfur subunit
LKHYAKLLAEDPVYAERAKLWDAKVKDVHEWLVEITFRVPNSGFRVGERETRNPESRTVVTYHESCHLSHGQKVVSQPRELLRAIPGLKLVELPEANWCCGSAGIYNLTQPEMAGQLLERKLAHIRATDATIVATANPGCLLQLVNGVKQRGMKLRIAHPITLLAEAYRAENS